jgi:hypothetical protein
MSKNFQLGTPATTNIFFLFLNTRPREKSGTLSRELVFFNRILMNTFVKICLKNSNDLYKRGGLLYLCDSKNEKINPYLSP